MLRNKEIGDINERGRNQEKLEQLQANKREIQRQIDEANFLREQAHEEYMKEKSQVDAVVQRRVLKDEPAADFK